MKNKTRKRIKRMMGVNVLNRVPFSAVFYAAVAFYGIRYFTRRGIFPSAELDAEEQVQNQDIMTATGTRKKRARNDEQVRAHH